MRTTTRIFPSVLMAAVLAVPLATTGCQQQPPPPAAATPAPAPASDDASYRQWEQETHREHRDLNQRADQDKKEYNDWRRTHQHH